MKCKPITLKDVKGGCSYVEVTVTQDGYMLLEHRVFMGQPIKLWGLFGNWHMALRVRKRRPGQTSSSDRLNNFISTSDAGLDLTRYDNNHRTFRYTGPNMQILSDLVNRQDLAGYLALIGKTRLSLFGCRYIEPHPLD